MTSPPEHGDDAAEAAGDVVVPSPSNDPLSMSTLDRRTQLARVHTQLFGTAETTRVGRFEVLERIGAGGMGVVYLGRDPDLDRHVALKLLRSVRSQRGDRLATAERRMRREARLMARLDHPNVVNIHEVGTHEGRLFMAMEHVAGTDLAGWLALERRSWRAIVDVFCRAGTGLHAAHQAGMVHRDFKPENVLIGESGVVKVTDFGLAGILSQWEPAEPAGNGAAAASPSVLDQLTTVDGIVGTPAFMSPEQFEGGEIDARSDQFSFCVALRGALLRERPFAGADPTTLAASVTRGELRARPSGHDVPAWVLDVVERGLAVDPRSRWPTMAELLAALRDDPVLRRRRRVRVLGAIALVGGLAATGGFLLADRETPVVEAVSTCEHLEAQLDGVWDQTRRTKVRSAILASGDAHAEDTAQRTLARLDDYADAWVSAATRACETSIALGDDPEAEAAQQRCLHHRRADLRELGAALSDADRIESDIDQALTAAERLPSLDRCFDPIHLDQDAPIPDDPALAEAVEALREVLAQPRSLLDLPNPDRVVEMARDLEGKAVALGYRPLLAEVRFVLGRALYSADDAEAIDVLERAFLDAEASDYQVLARAIGASRLLAMMDKQSVTEPLLAWSRLIEAKLDQETDASTRAKFECVMLSVHSATGDFEAALERGHACVRYKREAFGDDHAEVSFAYQRLAHTALTLGELDEGIAYAKKAMAIVEGKRRPSHSNATAPRHTLAQLYQASGRGAEAVEIMAELIPLVEREWGLDHTRVANYRMSYAQMLENVEAYEQARSQIEQALAVHERALGPDSFRVAMDLAVLGGIHAELGNLDEGRTALERAIAILQPDIAHPLEKATFRNYLGLLETKAGNLARAETELRAALDDAEALLGPDSGHLRFFLRDLAVVLHQRGRAGDAVPLLTRSLALFEADNDSERELAKVLLDLAEAERDAGAIEAAHGHAERALAVARELDDGEGLVARAQKVLSP